MDELNPDTTQEANGPQAPKAPPPGTHRLGTGEPPSAEMGKTRNDESQGGSKSAPTSSLGQIPIVSEILLPRKMAGIERTISRLVKKTTTQAAKLTVLCAGQEKARAEIVSAREAARRLSSEKSRSILDRLDRAERRLVEELPPACALPPRDDQSLDQASTGIRTEEPA